MSILFVFERNRNRNNNVSGCEGGRRLCFQSAADRNQMSLWVLADRCIPNNDVEYVTAMVTAVYVWYCFRQSQQVM